jgi:hypothetical protein
LSEYGKFDVNLLKFLEVLAILNTPEYKNYS